MGIPIGQLLQKFLRKSRHLFGALGSLASGSCTGHASNLGYPKLDGLLKKNQDI